MVSGLLSEVTQDVSLRDTGQHPGWAVVGRGTLLADRYRLDEPIGAGGMGRVWAARDTVLNRDVAIKLHQVDPAGGRAELERYLGEARATAALQHPNVVTVYDSGTDGDQAFLVMELLPGPTLQAYVNEHAPLPESEAVALGLQIASGMAAAHGAGVVHRDIKPSNVMFDAAGKLKIVDFGIARLTQTTATGLTITNAVIGSPPYLSPEQFQGSPADERSDLYALGCVLTTLLTGRPPFQGEHPLAYGHQHVYVAPPTISDRRPGVDTDLEALVGKLLMKDPRDRPGSAREVLQQLATDKPKPTASPSEPTTVAMPLAGTRARRRTRIVRLVLAGALTPAVTAIALAAGTTTADTPAATTSVAGQPAGAAGQQARHSVTSQHHKAAQTEPVNRTRPERSGSDTAQPSGRDSQQPATGPTAADADAKSHRAKTSQPKISKPKITHPKTTEPKITRPKITGPKITSPKITSPKDTGPRTDRPAKGGPQSPRQQVSQHHSAGQKPGGHKTTGTD